MGFLEELAKTPGTTIKEGAKTSRERISTSASVDIAKIRRSESQRVAATQQYRHVLAAYDRPFLDIDVASVINEFFETELPANAIRLELSPLSFIAMEAWWKARGWTDDPSAYISSLTGLEQLSGFPAPPSSTADQSGDPAAATAAGTGAELEDLRRKRRTIEEGGIAPWERAQWEALDREIKRLLIKRKGQKADEELPES